MPSRPIGLTPARSLPSPSGLAARRLASELLSKVLDDKLLLDSLLEEAGRVGGALAALESRDRAFVRTLLGTALRRHGQIAAALAERIERPLPQRSGLLRRILEIGAAQILFLDTASHAAVSLAVEQAARDVEARHFKGLVNAVLRALAGDPAAVLGRQDAPKLNTPDWLWHRWASHYGAARAKAIAQAHLSEAPLDLTVKSDAAGWAERLGGEVLPNGSVRLLPKGPIDALPGFAEGAWWVQDAAATLPVLLLGDLAGKKVADLCAAPGGKTAQLVAAGAQVCAFDISASRLARLGDNLARLGFTAETVLGDLTQGEWKEPLFDAVLIDAPCSATGTIRRHPDIAFLKNEADIAALARTQAKLLRRASAMLRPGGILLFATCSLEREEGELQVEAALKSLPLQPMPISTQETFGLAEPAGICAVRTLPDGLPHADPRFGGLAGFFIARFRRL